MTGERRTHATTASWWNGLGNLEACPQECGHGSLKGYATGRDEESTSCGWVSGEDSALSEKPHRVDRPYALKTPRPRGAMRNRIKPMTTVASRRSEPGSA